MAAIPGCLLAGIGINWLISMWFGRLLGDGRRVEAFGVAAALIVLAVVGINEARDVGIREASRQRAPAAFVDVLTRSASTPSEERKGDNPSKRGLVSPIVEEGRVEHDIRLGMAARREKGGQEFSK